MPKVIEGLREDLLQKSRDLLLSEGYDAVTIRGVAHVCGVAVGTVYNYFPSKDMLIASVILRDWMLAQQRMEQAVPAAAGMEEGLREMFAALYDFRCIYGTAWSQYTAAGGEIFSFRDRHEQLVGFLSGLLSHLAETFSHHPTAFAVRIAGEALLAHSQDPSCLQELLPVLIHLLQ